MLVPVAVLVLRLLQALAALLSLAATLSLVVPAFLALGQPVLLFLA